MFLIFWNDISVRGEDPGSRHLEKKVLDALVLPALLVSKRQKTKDIFSRKQ